MVRLITDPARQLIMMSSHCQGCGRDQFLKTKTVDPETKAEDPLISKTFSFTLIQKALQYQHL
jgi:hypothetical protein